VCDDDGWNMGFVRRCLFVCVRVLVFGVDAGRGSKLGRGEDSERDREGEQDEESSGEVGFDGGDDEVIHAGGKGIVSGSGPSFGSDAKAGQDEEDGGDGQSCFEEHVNGVQDIGRYDLKDVKLVIFHILPFLHPTLILGNGFGRLQITHLLFIRPQSKLLLQDLNVPLFHGLTASPTDSTYRRWNWTTFTLQWLLCLCHCCCCCCC